MPRFALTYERSKRQKKRSNWARAGYFCLGAWFGFMAAGVPVLFLPRRFLNAPIIEAALLITPVIGGVVMLIIGEFDGKIAKRPKPVPVLADIAKVREALQKCSAEAIHEDMRFCEQCGVENWHVSRTYKSGDRSIECRSCHTVRWEHPGDDSAPDAEDPESAEREAGIPLEVMRVAVQAIDPPPIADEPGEKPF
jgi:hypothetical protein